MKRLMLGVTAALLLSAGQAAADGLPSRSHVSAAPVEAGPNWTGFYLGVGIGGGAVEYTDDGDTGDGGAGGFFGTVTAGYDRVLRPGWVGGVFADYDFSGISSDTIDHEHSWSVGGRLGFLTSPSTLVYGTGGYTQAKFNNLDGDGVSATFDGYFVGAGVETFLRQDWTLKLEYRFSQFDEQFTGQDDIEPTMHSARAVLSYKFGHRN